MLEQDRGELERKSISFQAKAIYTISILLILISFKLSGQIRGTITDKSTGIPIPYASVFVKGQDKGATSDLNGLFRLSEDGPNIPLVISAIGYETLEVFSKEQMNIQLMPKVYVLPEIKVIPKKHKEKFILDRLKKIKSRSFVSPAGDYPWIVTRFFAYSKDFGNNSLLSEIHLLTLCHKDSAIFNLRLIAADQDGKPGADLLSKNLIVIARKGEQLTSISLPENNIIFPENGLFIAYEWLTAGQNYYQNIKSPRSSIEPMIGILPDEVSNEIWMYSKGNWYKSKLYYNPGQTVTGQLAIQLTLTK